MVVNGLTFVYINVVFIRGSHKKSREKNASCWVGVCFVDFFDSLNVHLKIVKEANTRLKT